MDKIPAPTVSGGVPSTSIRRPSAVQAYIIDILNAMARGLFASIVIGLIIKQLGTYTGLALLTGFGQVAISLMGPAVGVALAVSVKAPPLAVFCSAVTGALGAGTFVFGETGAIIGAVSGEPVGALLAALAGAELGKLVSGRTKVDIIVVPFVVVIAGGLVGTFVAPGVAFVMNALGTFINSLTTLYPFVMGSLISAVMGVLLVSPISSSALSISLGLDGLAAGAAVVGCCCQMVGFAVISYKENRVGGLISQGLGTAMLQMPNIVRNWKIFLPTILASLVIGPVSTVVFAMENNAAGAGMGTSGLVGQLNALSVMGPEAWWKILIVHIVLPAAVSLAFALPMRRAGWIKDGDMAL